MISRAYAACSSTLHKYKEQCILDFSNLLKTLIILKIIDIIDYLVVTYS